MGFKSKKRDYMFERDVSAQEPMTKVRMDRLRRVTFGHFGFILVLVFLPYVGGSSPSLFLAYGLFFPAILLLPGALVMTAWAMYRRRRLEFGLSGLSVILVMGILMDPAWSGMVSEPPVKRLRILTLNANAWAPLAEDAQPDIAGRTLDELADNILRADPDILFLQELWHPWGGPGVKLEKRFYKKLEHLHFVKEMRGERVKGSDLELVIGSRFPLSSKKVLEVSLGVEADSPYGPLRLVNLHPRGPRLSPQSMRKALEAQRACWQSVDHYLGDSKGPIILAGDLNSPPRAPLVSLLKGRLRDTFHEGGSGFGFTFPTRLPLWRIDYIFVAGSQVRVMEHQVLEWGSDHRAVMADVEIRPNE